MLKEAFKGPSLIFPAGMDGVSLGFPRRVLTLVQSDWGFQFDRNFPPKPTRP